MISVCMICLEMYSSGFGTGSEIIRPKINQIPPVLRLDPSVFIGGDAGMVVQESYVFHIEVVALQRVVLIFLVFALDVLYNIRSNESFFTLKELLS